MKCDLLDGPGKRTNRRLYAAQKLLCASELGLSFPNSGGCNPTHIAAVERWHQTLKNRVLLENYYLPGDLEAQVDAFVEHYNHLRYHKSLGNLTPTDVYIGCGQSILMKRERTKRQTIEHRRLQHRNSAA
jgi:hypothetical protein